MLTENIMHGGICRSCDAAITGASHTPPSPNEMYMQMKYFFDCPERGEHPAANPMEKAAWIHGELVRIHPFVDGNGRTARLIMNCSLMTDGFLPINITADLRPRYYECLDGYASSGEFEPFAELIGELETQRLKKYLAIIF
ncbi:MAG: Fic family protein [Ruminococcus sp.]|nr:Fic family protein [Ruminococcus sp.]